MNQYHYAIRSINLLSALKYGFVLGCVLMVLPGLLSGILLRQLIEGLVLAISGGFFAPDLGPLTTFYQMGWGLTWWVTVISVVGGGIVSAISGVVGPSTCACTIYARPCHSCTCCQRQQWLAHFAWPADAAMGSALPGYDNRRRSGL